MSNALLPLRPPTHKVISSCIMSLKALLHELNDSENDSHVQKVPSNANDATVNCRHAAETQNVIVDHAVKTIAAAKKRVGNQIRRPPSKNHNEEPKVQVVGADVIVMHKGACVSKEVIVPSYLTGSPEMVNKGLDKVADSWDNAPSGIDAYSRAKPGWAEGMFTKHISVDKDVFGFLFDGMHQIGFQHTLASVTQPDRPIHLE